jgi:translation initiation factor 2 subunit 1
MLEYPKVNDLVVCKIRKITNYGVFAELLEYDNLEGFIHISQVSSSWIKNIHNHVKLNQIRAAKVLRIDRNKKHIDLSLNRISKSDEKRKISDYRLLKRAQNLLNIVAKDIGIDFDTAWDKIAEPLIIKDKNLYSGFVNILKYGPERYSIDEKYIPKLLEVLEKNITIKDKTITGILEITSTKGNGAEIIKKGVACAIKDIAKIKIIYIAPGKYKVSTRAIDFKKALKKFEKLDANLSKKLKDCNYKLIKDNKK